MVTLEFNGVFFLWRAMMNWIITDFEEGARLTFKEPNDGSIHWNDAQKESVK